MSSFSETQTCPHCGLESFEYEMSYGIAGGLCLECGYKLETIESYLSLEEVNEERIACGADTLTELFNSTNKIIENNNTEKGGDKDDIK